MKEMRLLAQSLTHDAFAKQMGPFVLVQRVPGASTLSTDPMGLPVNVATTQMARPENMAAGALALLFEFEDLGVVTLPPLSNEDQITVGRLPDCEVVLDDASVSKRHAVLRWNETAQSCTVEDLGSTNGTVLNASSMIRRETSLRDGDILSFGDVQFWFLLTKTLHAKLSTASNANKMISRSG